MRLERKLPLRFWQVLKSSSLCIRLSGTSTWRLILVFLLTCCFTLARGSVSKLQRVGEGYSSVYALKWNRWSKAKGVWMCSVVWITRRDGILPGSFWWLGDVGWRLDTELTCCDVCVPLRLWRWLGPCTPSSTQILVVFCFFGPVSCCQLSLLMLLVTGGI